MQRKWHKLAFSNLREDFLYRDYLSFRNLSDDILAVKQKIRLVTDMESLPSYLKRKVLQRLIQVVDIEPSVLPSLFIPIFSLITDPFELLNFLLVKWISLKVIVVGCKELRDGTNAIVFQYIAEVSQMVDHTNFLYLVDWLSEIETNQVWANRIMLSIFYLHSFLRNVHPRSCLTPEVYDVETFEAVVLELGVFWGQSNSLDLQRQPI